MTFEEVNKYITLAFAIVAFVLSIINFVRALQKSSDERELAFALKKLELFNALTAGTVAVMRGKRLLQRIRSQAEELDIQHLVIEVDKRIGDAEPLLKGLAELRDALDRVPAGKQGHRELLELIEKRLPVIADKFNPARIDEGMLQVIDPAEVTLRLVKERPELRDKFNELLR